MNCAATNPILGDWTVLSLTQPWASALFVPGLKRIETRRWRTNYRGRLYIHAAKGYPDDADAMDFTAIVRDMGHFKGIDLPLGAIIGHVDLVSMQPTSMLIEEVSETEKMYGNYSARRWGWLTINPVLLPEPIPARGMLGLWRYGQVVPV